MGKIRDKMQDDLVLRGLSPHTQRSYLFRAEQFVRYFGKSPTLLGTDEVTTFLLHIAEERKLSPSTHAVFLASIKFLYEVTLERPEVVALIPHPKIPRKLPVFLS